MNRILPPSVRAALAAAALAVLGPCGSFPALAADGHDAHDSQAAAPATIGKQIVRIDRSKVERPVDPAAVHGAAAGHAPAAEPAAHGANGASDHANAPPSAEELRRLLQDKVNEVRAAQARAASRRVATSRKVAPARSAGHGGDGHGERPAAAGNGHGHAAHWGYDGENGPAAWGSMKPEFSLCSSGTRQSPIDIRGGVRVDLEPIRFDYHPSGFSVIDNGHTVQANVAPGNTIQVNGRTFELLQFHFHRPSEERINGRNYPMVAHLVHKDLDGRLAVVAVLMDQGKSHPMVQLVWNSLPLAKNEPLSSPVPIDMAQLLPEDRRYYTYMGSLTTPPCSEGVLWLVLKQPAAVSLEQIGVFTHLYPMNARPIQSASQRLIKESF